MLDDSGRKERNGEKKEIRNWIFNTSIQSRLRRSLFKRRSEEDECDIVEIKGLLPGLQGDSRG